ncbi:hypothetical protein N9U84_01740 [Candidatus Pelagibacter sp.]|nr:hypothetical protein [Candidatus Pelagibacter sp.]
MSEYFKKKFWKHINRRSLNNWYKRNFSSPSPEFVKHQVIKKYNLQKSLWIETGTYYGDTTKILSDISEKVISIELDKRLYDLAIKKFKNLKKINVINGQSQNLLEDILKNESYKNLCLFLDAHTCLDHITNKLISKNETLETPIMIELDIIENYIKKFNNVNILIDDIRLFDGKNQNYPNINEIVDWARKNNSSWFIEHDIFIINYKAD